MTIASILDSIIAVILVITTASLLVTALYELIGEILQRRAKRLYSTVKLALDNPGQSTLVDYVFSHSLTKSSWNGDSPRQPSDYFSRSVLPIFFGPRAPVNIDSQRLAQVLLRFIRSSRGSKLEQYPALENLWNASGKNEEKFLQEAPKWAEDIFHNISTGNQNKRSFWYFIIGLVLCSLVNINVITISTKIAQKNDLSYLVESARTLTQTAEDDQPPTAPPSQQNVAGYFANLLELSVHVGLEPGNALCDNGLTALIGRNDLDEDDINAELNAELNNKFEAYCGASTNNDKSKKDLASDLRCALKLIERHRESSEETLEKAFKSECIKDTTANGDEEVRVSAADLRCFVDNIGALNEQNPDAELSDEELSDEELNKELITTFETFCSDGPIARYFSSLKARFLAAPFSTTIGYFLTALLLSLGSGFWLSLLKKSLSVRAYVYGGAKKAVATKG